MSTPAVAFLRAVNVGGRNKLPQRPLAEALTAVLGTPVRHYLQSGNLVCSDADPEHLAQTVAETIRTQTGLEIAVIARSALSLRELVASDPWPDEVPVKVHLVVWEGDHDPVAERAMADADWRGDEIRFVSGGAWLRYADASHGRPLGAHAIERKLKVTATARNARTMTELVRLCDELG